MSCWEFRKACRENRRYLQETHTNTLDRSRNVWLCFYSACVTPWDHDDDNQRWRLCINEETVRWARWRCSSSKCVMMSLHTHTHTHTHTHSWGPLQSAAHMSLLKTLISWVQIGLNGFKYTMQIIMRLFLTYFVTDGW